MATHSSVLAWRIPGMGEPGGLPSMGSRRVGHDWSDLAAAAAGETGSLFACLFKSHGVIRARVEIHPSNPLKFLLHSIFIPQKALLLSRFSTFSSPMTSNFLKGKVWVWCAEFLLLLLFKIFLLLVYDCFTVLCFCCTTMWISLQFSHSVMSDSCDPMNRSTPALPVHHQLPESTQTHVHRVGDAIQPSHPLSSLSPPALNLAQHQGLFKWVSSLHQVAKVLEFQLQHQSFQWTPRTDLR